MTTLAIDTEQTTESAGLTVHEHTARVWDSAELFYRHWQPATPSDQAVVMIHRGHEHSGRYLDVVEALGIDDVNFFAWDARGHGRSPGQRGYAPSFGHFVKDLDSFVRFVSAEHEVPIENMVVVSHSVGAVMAATWVHDYAPPIRGLVLATPALRVKLYVPLAVPGLRLLQKIRGKGKAKLSSYVKAKMLTHDPAQARAYDEDELITRDISVNILLDMHDTATRLIADAGTITTPALMLTGGADWVVKLKPQYEFFNRLSSGCKQLHFYPGMYHDILHEKDRHLVMGAIGDFIRARLADPSPPQSLVDADRKGYTRREYEQLQQPLPRYSPKAWSYGLTTLTLKTLGKMSGGIQLGWRRGFDSGSSLDYVYENRARGMALLGRWFDRKYLDGAGWAGIRQRKVNLENTLATAIERVHEADLPIHLLDIATGHGRYMLEAIKANTAGGRAITALLRDKDEKNVEAARQLAGEMKLDGVECRSGDALDESSLAEVNPRPSIAVVSGLYELFNDNEMIRRSLRGMHAAVLDGGYLVYTNQPWHPQLELIARCLTNRDGEPWIMRRRTQQEMDDLVRAAGFEKIDMHIDDTGIFTVSLARKVSL